MTLVPFSTFLSPRQPNKDDKKIYSAEILITTLITKTKNKKKFIARLRSPKLINTGKHMKKMAINTQIKDLNRKIKRHTKKATGHTTIQFS